MQRVNIQPVKGTRDFYPDIMRFRSWLFGKMRITSQKFGFEEYEGPVIESVELYLDKTSEEIIKNQPDYLIVLSWHIGDELVKIMKKFGYKGKFIIPLPKPRIVK